MIIVDASAWLAMLTGELDPARLEVEEAVTAAHFDAEVLSGLRRLARRKEIDVGVAERFWEATRAAPIERLPAARHARLWSLSAAVSAYDAPYLAGAVDLSATLLTADEPFARGAAPHCAVELVG